jgi:hypothetical protein
VAVVGTAAVVLGAVVVPIVDGVVVPAAAAVAGVLTSDVGGELDGGGSLRSSPEHAPRMSAMATAATHARAGAARPRTRCSARP